LKEGEIMTRTLIAHQHLAAAVESLACGAGPIGERLRDAAGHLAAVETADVPEDLRERFEALRHGLRGDGAPRQGTPGDSDANGLARAILALKDDMGARTAAPRRMT
jgi:hypothetical protein